MTHRQSLLNSFRCAIRGIAIAIRGQRNIKIQIAIGCVVVMTGVFFQVNMQEWITLLLCIGAVLTSEVLNCGIEYTVDLASPEQHPLARNAKDAAAGAVMMAAIVSAIVGLMIFIPKFSDWVSR
ncbi:UNVERIFIED_CONTAM: hypothetical protein GTU68_000820 [Idotea baltica]|nr:hypothetical protein [Idotea baltica]